MMGSSRMRIVTSLISFSLKIKKRRARKKVLDVRFKLGYNELIKSEEWFLAHKDVCDETGKGYYI